MTPAAVTAFAIADSEFQSKQFSGGIDVFVRPNV